MKKHKHKWVWTEVKKGIYLELCVCGRSREYMALMDRRRRKKK